MNTKIHYGTDHRHFWVTELEAAPTVGSVVELDIMGVTHRYRVQRTTLTQSVCDIDRLHIWAKEIDIQGSWIPVPLPSADTGDARFHQVIPQERWLGLIRGADYQLYRPVKHPEIYWPPSALGAWSGGRDEDGSYLDQ